MNFDKTALILVGFQSDYFAKDGIFRNVVEEPGRNVFTLYGSVLSSEEVLTG